MRLSRHESCRFLPINTSEIVRALRTRRGSVTSGSSNSASGLAAPAGWIGGPRPRASVSSSRATASHSLRADTMFDVSLTNTFTCPSPAMWSSNRDLCPRLRIRIVKGTIHMRRWNLHGACGVGMAESREQALITLVF